MDTNEYRKRIHDPNGYLDEQLQEAYAASEPGDYQLPNLMRSQPDDLVPLIPDNSASQDASPIAAQQDRTIEDVAGFLGTMPFGGATRATGATGEMPISVGMGAPTPAPYQREAIPFPTSQPTIAQSAAPDFSDERRNQLVGEANSGRLLSGIGQALSGFLAPVTGRSQDSVTNQFEGYRKQRAADTVGQFDAKKALYQSMQAKLAEKAEETRRWEVERSFDKRKMEIDLAHKAGILSQQQAELEFKKAQNDRDALLREKEFGERARHNRVDEAIGFERAKNPPGLFLTPAQQIQVQQATNKETRDFTTDKSLNEARNALAELQQVVSNPLFEKPEESGLFGAGASARKLAPEWAANIGLSPEQQTFIQKVQRLNVGERAKVFGASLSKNEQTSWDRAAAMLSSNDPRVFKEAVTTIKQLTEKALTNMEAGYSDEAKALAKQRGFQSPLSQTSNGEEIEMIAQDGGIYRIPVGDVAKAEANGLRRK